MGNFTERYRRFIELTVLLFIAALMVADSYKRFPFEHCFQHDIVRNPVNVTAVQINTINKPIRIAKTGSIEKAAFVPVSAEVSGRISEIYVTEGQLVKAGQSLLKIEASSNGEGALPQIQSNYENVLKEFNHYKKLYEQGAIARRQYESVLLRLQEAQERLNNGQSANSPTNIATTILNGFVTIQAPIDGIVTGVSTTPGKMVQVGQQLMALGSGQEVEAVVQLEQNDLYLVNLGTPATIQLSNKTIAGQVSSIYPEIQENQIAYFLTHIKLANTTNGILTPGISANVQIDTGKSATVLAVPQVSVCHDAHGQSFIYVVANGNAVLQQITIGEELGDLIEITANMPQESLVITSNIDKLRNGVGIAVMQ